MVNNPHQAQDVTQGVFLALAQNARPLSRHPVLSGWLHRTARNLAAKAVRSDVRRQTHEQEAAAMNELLAHPDPAAWKTIAPHLDEALGELGEPDRDALLLRYFERKSARDMASLLGISDEAAQKRVTRATERLREGLVKRGITVGSGGLVVLISANAVQSAPVGLLATVSTFALAGTITTSAIITTTHTLAMTTLQKAIITAALATAVGTGVFAAHQSARWQSENTTLQQQLVQLQTDNQSLSNRLATPVPDVSGLSAKEFNELLKLRGEVGALRRQAGELEQLRTENQTIRRQLAEATRPAAAAGADPSAFKLISRQTVDAAKYIGLAMAIYSADHNEQYPTNFDGILSCLNADYTNSSGNLSLDTFELLNTGVANRQTPHLIALRERAPRRTPEGRWERIYLLADGSVQTLRTDDGNFDSLEQTLQQASQ